MTETNEQTTQQQNTMLTVNQRMHEKIDKRIAGCLSVMVQHIGPDLLTIECGILSTLSYSFKEQMLKEMREALL